MTVTPTTFEIDKKLRSWIAIGANLKSNAVIESRQLGASPFDRTSNPDTTMASINFPTSYIEGSGRINPPGIDFNATLKDGLFATVYPMARQRMGIPSNTYQSWYYIAGLDIDPDNTDLFDHLIGESENVDPEYTKILIRENTENISNTKEININLGDDSFIRAWSALGTRPSTIRRGKLIAEKVSEDLSKESRFDYNYDIDFKKNNIGNNYKFYIGIQNIDSHIYPIITSEPGAELGDLLGLANAPANRLVKRYFQNALIFYKTRYSVQFFRQGALESAERFIGWASTIYGKDKLVEMGLSLLQIHPIEEISELVSSKWEERVAVEIDIGYCQRYINQIYSANNMNGIEVDLSAEQDYNGNIDIGDQ